MNIEYLKQTDSRLMLKLIDAIQDPQKWGAVLDYIIATTGAEAAIITLRDKKNCQIVNDVHLEQEYHSPLIRGFSGEAIMYYLSTLRTIDPWAEFQKSNYPHRPMMMSKVCPVSSIKDTAFFDWLQGEGFHDTIVFELDRMAGYWTAINFFVTEAGSPEADQLYRFAQTNYDILRNAWCASQELEKARQANRALFTHASDEGAPVCLASANGELVECNDLFRNVIATDAVRLSGKGQKLSFGREVSVHGLDRWEQHEFLSHDSDAAPLLLLATPVDPDPRFADKREQMWLLTCSHTGTASPAPSLKARFNLDALTGQERRLYERILDGEVIEQAGLAIGIKRTRAFEVWNAVRAKLGITSVHELRASAAAKQPPLPEI